MAMPGPFEPGQRIRHADFGEGVVIGTSRDGYLRAFFPDGERQVPVHAVQPLVSWNDRVLSSVEGSPTRLRRAWLAREAHALPLIDSAAALTAAPIDLLPHQVVLTHRIATAAPRRFLVADEVGLGKDHRDGAAAARTREPRRAAARADGGTRRPRE